MFKHGLWLVAAAVACIPAAALSAGVQFAAPAGNLPAGHLRGAAYDAVLPSGRIVTPFGESVVTGVNALGVALTPDGRFAVVSNDDDGPRATRSTVDPDVRGGYSLAAVDTSTMRVADRFAMPGETYFTGITAVVDPLDAARTLVFAAGGRSGAVEVFDLDSSGHFAPDARHTIAISEPLDNPAGNIAPSVTGSLVAAPDGRRIYVVDVGGNGVATIDVATRTTIGASRPVGFSPFGAAVAGDRLLVTNEGLMPYARIADPPLVPPFLGPVFDPQMASSLAFVALAADAAGPRYSLPLDVAPDGVRVVGGAHPTAVTVTPDAAYAFVAMTNVDRIATVRLGDVPVVVGGTELRLFDRGPYGTQPAAMSLSSDGTRLYVALAGLNAVAVLDARDPIHLHRLGLIPTGWYPSAVALSRDDRTLFVANAKGFGHDLAVHDIAALGGDVNPTWSTLQKIDLGTVRLTDTTLTTLKNTRATRSRAPAYPHELRNVVVILEESKTFDSMLGDVGGGPADPSFVRFGSAITPNLHALAARFGVAGNMYADAEHSGAAHQLLGTGIATIYSERSRLTKRSAGARDANDDPEDYPRAGALFHNLARHHLSFRDYGDALQVSGYDRGEALDPLVDDPGFAGIADRRAPTQGLGGRFTGNVPIPAILRGHVDLNYPGWNLRIRDERRAHEFIADYGALVRAHRQPRYTHIWLPDDRTGSGPNIPPPNEEVADGDRALGAIVQYLSRLASWKNTVIFVLSDTAAYGYDHVDDYRTYAIVISPFAKPHAIGMRHLSTASVLKTTEQILHLPPLSLGDLLATDMSDFFTTKADIRPFTAVNVPEQTGG